MKLLFYFLLSAFCFSAVSQEFMQNRRKAFQPVTAAGITRLSIVTNATALNTGTFDITVPASASLAIVFVGGYYSTDYFFTNSPPNGIQIGASTCVALCDANNGTMEAAAFYLNAPPTGLQTITYDWAINYLPASGVAFYFIFYSGTSATTPIRQTQIAQANPDPSITGITMSAGNVLAVWASEYESGGTYAAPTWTGATQIKGGRGAGSLQVDFAENTSVTSSVSVDWPGEDGTLIGIVIQ